MYPPDSEIMKAFRSNKNALDREPANIQAAATSASLMERSRLWQKLALIAGTSLSASATAMDIITLDTPPPPPPDFSFLDRPYSQCKYNASESAPLTAAETCWIEKLSKRCAPSDDCLVACLASAQARGIGGGCWHVCFATKFLLREWREPEGSDCCRKLGRVDGM